MHEKWWEDWLVWREEPGMYTRGGKCKIIMGRYNGVRLKRSWKLGSLGVKQCLKVDDPDWSMQDESEVIRILQSDTAIERMLPKSSIK